MVLGKIVTAYKTLGEANVTTLEDEDVLKIIKARKVMRPYVQTFDDFLKDCNEKLKPENFKELQDKRAIWNHLSEEEKMEYNQIMMLYGERVKDLANSELNREVELDEFDKITEKTAFKLIRANNWSLNKLEEIEILLL